MSHEELNFQKEVPQAQIEQNYEPFPFESRCNQYENKTKPNCADVRIEARYNDVNQVLVRIGNLDFFVHADWLRPHSPYWERRLDGNRIQ